MYKLLTVSKTKMLAFDDDLSTARSLSNIQKRWKALCNWSKMWLQFRGKQMLVDSKTPTNKRS